MMFLSGFFNISILPRENRLSRLSWCFSAFRLLKSSKLVPFLQITNKAFTVKIITFTEAFYSTLWVSPTTKQPIWSSKVRIADDSRNFTTENPITFLSPANAVRNVSDVHRKEICFTDVSFFLNHLLYYILQKVTILYNRGRNTA